MILELAKPVSLLLTILSILAVFHTAFLSPATSITDRMLTSSEILALAMGCSLVSGLIFRETGNGSRLTATLPIQTFLWSIGTMLPLFAASWYYESYYAPLQTMLGR